MTIAPEGSSEQETKPAVPPQTKKRDNSYAEMWFCIRKWRRYVKISNWIIHAMVSVSLVGNIFATIAAVSAVLRDYPVVLGILVSLPTIIFAVDRGFSVSRRNEWWRNAESKYAEVVDKFHYDDLNVSDALKLKLEADKELGLTPGVTIATQQPQA